MSKIDEIIQCIWELYSKVDDDDNTIYRVLAKKLEQIRSYVELGELIYKESAFGIIGSEMIIDFVALNKHHKQISNLLKQIREQDNGCL